MPDVRPADTLSKYVVFKREDFEQTVGVAQLSADDISDRLDGMVVDDCFVLRSTDVFGAQALFGYAHVIQTVLEVEALPGRAALFTDEERKSLMDLIELVNEVGLEWQWNRGLKKVPT